MQPDTVTIQNFYENAAEIAVVQQQLGPMFTVSYTFEVGAVIDPKYMCLQSSILAPTQIKRRF